MNLIGIENKDFNFTALKEIGASMDGLTSSDLFEDLTLSDTDLITQFSANEE